MKFSQLLREWAWDVGLDPLWVDEGRCRGRPAGCLQMGLPACKRGEGGCNHGEAQARLAIASVSPWLTPPQPDSWRWRQGRGNAHIPGGSIP